MRGRDTGERKESEEGDKEEWRRWRTLMVTLISRLGLCCV